MTHLEVSEACHALGLRAIAAVIEPIRVAAAPTELRQTILEAAQAVQQRFSTAASVRAEPEIAEHHRILKAVGVKPKSHPPSTQKLLEFARKKGQLPEINNLVDAYNLVSIRRLCSLGAHDLHRIELPVRLTLLEGDEAFQPLGSAEPQPVVAGEFGYVDARRRVLCRLDSRQADFSKVTTQTTAALLIVETTCVHSEAQLNVVLDEACGLLHRYCT